MTEEELQAINDRIDRDRNHWLSRWIVVQQKDFVRMFVYGLVEG